MNDREEWRERVRDIRATSTIWYDDDDLIQKPFLYEKIVVKFNL